MGENQLLYIVMPQLETRGVAFTGGWEREPCVGPSQLCAPHHAPGAACPQYGSWQLWAQGFRPVIRGHLSAQEEEWVLQTPLIRPSWRLLHKLQALKGQTGP
jgi:hypothetical protein